MTGATVSAPAGRSGSRSSNETRNIRKRRVNSRRKCRPLLSANQQVAACSCRDDGRDGYFDLAPQTRTKLLAMRAARSTERWGRFERRAISVDDGPRGTPIDGAFRLERRRIGAIRRELSCLLTHEKPPGVQNFCFRVAIRES